MKRMIAGFAAVLILSACSDSDTAVKDRKPAVLDVPETMEEILAYPKGDFAGEKPDYKKMEAQLDQFPKKMEGDQAFQRVLPLVAESYKPVQKEYKEFTTEFKDITDKPEFENEQKQAVEEVNAVILLDASGSMASKVPGGSKMDLAKKAVGKFAASLPDKTNVLLRVYGQKGTGADIDKKLSCGSTDVVYPLKPYESASFSGAMKSVKPAGWTPLASAIQKASEDLKDKNSRKSKNVIYIVSDGIETCGGDPVNEARKLHQSDIEAEVNIIGFDVDNAGQKQLKEAATAGGGEFKSVSSQQELEYEINTKWQEHIKNVQWMWWRNENQLSLIHKRNDYSNDLRKISNRYHDILSREMDGLDYAYDYLIKKKKLDYKDFSSWNDSKLERLKILGDWQREQHEEIVKEMDEKEEKLREEMNAVEDQNRD